MAVRQHLRVVAAVTAFALTFANVARGEEKREAGIGTIRLAISTSSLALVHQNDAQAAIRAWTTSLAKRAGLALDPKTSLMQRPAELVRAVKEGSVDCFVLSVLEFLYVEQLIDKERLLMDDYNGEAVGEEIVVLVPARSAFQNLEHLRGRPLLVHENSRMIPWEIWMRDAIAEKGTGPREYFGQISLHAKPSLVVLPVFFGKADACVVTRRSLELMFEMNPQLRTGLRVVAASPPLAGGFLACRAAFDPDIKHRFLTMVAALTESTSGNQTLALFQSRRLRQYALPELKTTFELLRRHEAASKAVALAGN